MKYLLSLLLCCFSLSAFAQLAVIEDPDGYTNLRDAPSRKGKVIHRIYDNELFIIYDDNPADAWVKVQVFANPYSLSCSGDRDFISGFVHGSRVKYLDDLPRGPFPEFSFRYVIQAFDSSAHIIIRASDSPYVESVDGRHAWGTDFTMPRTEVVEMQVSIDGQTVFIPPVFYQDIFECDNDFTVRRNGETYIISQENSDGAGHYSLSWVINKEGVQQRLIWMQ